MKVKDVLALACSNLGREDLKAALYDALEPFGELSALLRCYNLVENEIALDYFPLKTEETLCCRDGKIDYTAFSYAPVTVSDAVCHGSPTPFELYPAYLRLYQVSEGEILVRYSYSPREKSLFDESDFNGKISARLMSFGVASEFCLTTGQYSEAALWEEKYRDALHAAGILRKKLSIRSRRWV